MEDFDGPVRDPDDDDESGRRRPNLARLDRAEEILALLIEETGGAHREGQVQLLRAAVQAVKEGRPLEGLAPTATGKSFVALLVAVLSGLRTVVATATNHLQDQYIGDLEVISDVLSRRCGITFSWAVLKGQSKYVCNLKVANLREDGQTTLKVDKGNASLREDLQTLGPWLRSTDTGDVAEVNVDLSAERRDQLMGALTLRQGECLGRADCPSAEGCFLLAARRRAYLADVVIVPTALLMTHVASGGKILRPHELVVLDEAHKAWEIAANSLGGCGEIGGNRVIDLARKVGRVAAPNAEGRIARFHALGESLSEELRRRQQLAERGQDDAINIRNGIGGTQADGQPRHPQLQKLVVELADLANGLASHVNALPRTGGDLAQAHRNQAVKLLGDLLADLAAMWVTYPGEVVWITNNRLKKATVQVAERLWETGWNRGQTVVLAVSATVPQDMGVRLGMWDTAHEPGLRVEVPSPLPVERLRLFLPATAPNPSGASKREWLTYVASTMEDLTIAMGGRALLLFTSHEAMREVGKRLRYSLSEAHLRVLMQSDPMSKRQLVAEKLKDPTSVLLATQGFFEGVNLPGPAVRLVAIDKMPFPSPSDPLFEAMRDYFGNGFQTVDKPYAVTLLQQGLGRLQRTVYDDGLLAVLDSRIGPNGKTYRKSVWNKLPPWGMVHELGDALDFIRSLPPVIDPSPGDAELDDDEPFEADDNVTPIHRPKPRPRYRQKRNAG